MSTPAGGSAARTEARPTARSFDVIVLGVGGMGSAACYHLARRGYRVLGLEQYQLGHGLGSSHGETRLIRQAYFEHPDYVPLLKCAYELWAELEADSGTRLLHLNGLVIYGPATGGRVLPGVRLSGERYGIPLRKLDRPTALAAYPMFSPPAGAVAVLEPGAGFLEVEAAVVAHAQMAERHGADLRFGEPALEVAETSASVTVTTSQGVYSAAQLVVTAGPWSARWLPTLAPRLAVHRVLLFWYAKPPTWPAADSMPCFGFDLDDGFYYGVPALSGRGIKIGRHVPGEPVADPTQLRRSVDAADLEPVRAFAAACLPGLASAPTDRAACMYTMTPDEHFVVDRAGRVSFAAGFSGHGFKFAPVIGAALADLAMLGRTALPVDFLRWRW